MNQTFGSVWIVYGYVWIYMDMDGYGCIQWIY